MLIDNETIIVSMTHDAAAVCVMCLCARAFVPTCLHGYIRD